VTDDQLHLLRVFFEEVERAILNTAELMDLSAAGTLAAAEAMDTASKLRTLAAQTRWIRRQVMPPDEPLVN